MTRATGSAEGNRVLDIQRLFVAGAQGDERAQQEFEGLFRDAHKNVYLPSFTSDEREREPTIRKYLKWAAQDELNGTEEFGPGRLQYVVSTEGGRAAGMSYQNIIPGDDFSIAYLNYFAVRPDLRGAGEGRRLARGAVRLAARESRRTGKPLKYVVAELDKPTPADAGAGGFYQTSFGMGAPVMDGAELAPYWYPEVYGQEAVPLVFGIAPVDGSREMSPDDYVGLTGMVLDDYASDPDVYSAEQIGQIRENIRKGVEGKRIQIAPFETTIKLQYPAFS